MIKIWWKYPFVTNRLYSLELKAVSSVVSLCIQLNTSLLTYGQLDQWARPTFMAKEYLRTIRSEI